MGAIWLVMYRPRLGRVDGVMESSKWLMVIWLIRCNLIRLFGLWLIFVKLMTGLDYL